MSSPGTNPPWHVLLTSSGGHHKNQHRCREGRSREKERERERVDWSNDEMPAEGCHFSSSPLSHHRNTLLWWRILDETVSRDILYFILFNYAQLPLNLFRCSFRQSIQFFISLYLFLSLYCCFSFVCPPSQFRFQFPISRLAFWYELKCSIEFSLLLCAKLSMQVALSLSLSVSLCFALWPLQSVPCCAWRVDFWITIFINLCIWNWQVSLFFLVSVYIECAASFLIW